MRGAGDAWESRELYKHPAAYSLTSIGEDEAGELYVTHMAWGGLFRLVVP